MKSSGSYGLLSNDKKKQNEEDKNENEKEKDE